MEKLRSSDSYNVFYGVAHRLILTQEEEFAYKDIYGKYLNCCDESVDKKYAHAVLLDKLDDCLNCGLVRLNKDEKYETIFINEKPKAVRPTSAERVL